MALFGISLQRLAFAIHEIMDSLKNLFTDKAVEPQLFRVLSWNSGNILLTVSFKDIDCVYVDFLTSFNYALWTQCCTF